MTKKLNYTIINLAALMLFLYIGVSNIGLWMGFFSKFLSVMAPFIVGFAFAYALTPLVNFLREKGASKNFAVTLVVVGLVLLVVAVCFITFPLIYEQFSSFVEMILKFIDNLAYKFDINLGSFEIKIEDYLNSILSELGNFLTSSTVDVLNRSLGFFSKFIVGFVAFIYFLADMSKIRKWVRIVSSKYNKRTFEYIECLDIEIFNWLKGLIIFMIIQLFEYSLLFFIVGHPNWLILGILACLTTIIPYFGGVLTNIIAILTATVVSTPLTIATIIICLIFPQLDGYVISPHVYGKTNDINPLITIMVVSVGGTLFGLVGIVIALPVYLLLRTTYHFYKGDLKRGFSKVKEAI